MRFGFHSVVNGFQEKTAGVGMFHFGRDQAAKVGVADQAKKRWGRSPTFAPIRTPLQLIYR